MPAPVMTVSGTVISWGENRSGQLGLGSSSENSAPAALTGGALADKPAGVVEAGIGHSQALTTEGRVLARGDNTHGQLGNGTRVGSSLPAAVDMSGALAGRTVRALSAGGFHTLALTADGRVFAWGRNDAGQLGDGTQVDRTAPVAVDTTGVLNGKLVVAISAGEQHSLALTSEGRVYAWGENGLGQLGNGSLTGSDGSIPLEVDATGLLNGRFVSAIAAGSLHSLALTPDGRVFRLGIQRQWPDGALWRHRQREARRHPDRRQQ